MKYKTLQDLLFHSSSTREYFLSLPVSTQLALHEYNASIHTAADLHFFQLSIKQCCPPYAYRAVHRWDD